MNTVQKAQVWLATHFLPPCAEEAEIITALLAEREIFEQLVTIHTAYGATPDFYLTMNKAIQLCEVDK